MRKFAASVDDCSKISVSDLLSSKLRDEGTMKLYHAIIICSLTVLFTILDLPLVSCDDVILQKRVSTDGGRARLINKTSTNDRALSGNRNTGGENYPHSQSVGSAMVQVVSRQSSARPVFISRPVHT